MRQWLIKHEKRVIRFLEMMPGLISWSLIIFPLWGAFLAPTLVAYYIIAFDVYWLYRSLLLASLSLMAHFRIRASENYDWLGDVKGFADWKKVHHAVVVPIVKEPGKTLVRTLQSLAGQTVTPKQIIPIIAFECRAGMELNTEREMMLKEKFEGVFAKLIFTYHPAGIVGEVVGKSANSAWAAKELAKEMKKHKDWKGEMMTITSTDADVVFHPNHFAAITYNFLDNPARYRRIWQGAIMFYNNIDNIAWPMRVFNRIASVVYMGLLMRPDRLINFSTYTASWKLMEEIGFWDTDVIPEDYRLFFKAYFATKGEVEVDPIFLPVYMDAAEAFGFWKTFVNTYEQVKRWAWGASDDAYILKRYILDTQAPIMDKTIRVLKVLEDHFLWPVNWFVLTLGATLPPLLNQNFSRTIIGKTLPQVSSAILTLSMVSILAIIFIDWRSKPKIKDQPMWKKVVSSFEFVLLPVVGFFFAALPGLDAHTRLMIGRYIEYRVTEKV